LRKILSILILSVFIYNAIGFLAVHQALSAYYKYLGMKQVEKPSEKELIELLIFNKKDILSNRIDFRWIHSREFKYNGDMYDIVEKKETNDQLIVYCINDTKEKKLEEEFEKRVRKNSSGDKNRPNINNINFNFLSEPAQTEGLNLCLVFRVEFFCFDTNLYKSFLTDTPSPPPRLV
jgi:hypothetical protein